MPITGKCSYSRWHWRRLRLTLGPKHVCRSSTCTCMRGRRLYAAPNPPPMCAPFEIMPRWDPAQPLDAGLTFHTMPPCEDPILPAATDEQVMHETIAVMEQAQHHRHGQRRAGVDGHLEGRGARRGSSPAAICAISETPDQRTSRAHRRTSCARCTRAACSRCSAKSWRNMKASRPTIRAWSLTGRWPRSSTSRSESISGRAAQAILTAAARGYRARNSSRAGAGGGAGPPSAAARLHHARRLSDDRRPARAVVHASAGLCRHLGIVYTEPRPAFYRYLQELVEAGYGDRIMFGSDQMIWPGIIEPSIQVIEQAPFLTPGAEARHPLQQCRAIPAPEQGRDRAPPFNVSACD